MNEWANRTQVRSGGTRRSIAAVFMAMAGLLAVLVPALPAAAATTTSTTSSVPETTTTTAPSTSTTSTSTTSTSTTSTTAPTSTSSTTTTAPAPGPAATVASSGPAPIPGDLWDTNPAVGAGQTYVALQGAVGEYITGGKDYLHTLADSRISVTDTNGLVSVHVQSDEEWWGGFKVMDTIPQTAVGFYDQLTGLGTPNTTRGQLSWTGDGHSCSFYHGWYAVDEVSRVDGVLQSLTLRFSQSCDSLPAMFGKVHWVAGDTTTPPGVQPIPNDLWNADLGVGGDYVYLEGAAGDPITYGESYLETRAYSPIYLSQSPGSATITVYGSKVWTGQFHAMENSELQPGYYPDLRAWQPANPVKGSAIWYGPGGPCTTVAGWFAVDDIVRVDGLITRLSLRFEQSCNGGPPMHGKVVLGTDPPPLPPGSPFGSLDQVVPVPGGVAVTGWAIDPDVASPIVMRAEVGDSYATFTAFGPRPDLASPYPGYGTAHGFGALLALPPGTHQLCVWAENLGLGSDTLLGCRSVVVLGGSPFGSLDSVRTGLGSVTVGGWAIDPDTASSIQVHVYVDGSLTPLTADGNRPDLASAFPGYGAPHGFSAQIAAAPGSHLVCVYGINSGAGGNSQIGCRTVVVPGGSPFGSLDSVRTGLGSVSVSGWAIDPDTASSIGVHVYVDGSLTPLTADGNRPDLASAFPGYGAPHGFSAQIAAAPGSHLVCVYGINAGAGDNSQIGCRTVVVPGGSPFGSLDLAAGAPGKVNVSGWAIDPDTAASIQVHVYVDGSLTPLTADGNRPDLATAFPGYGAPHGFSAQIAAAPGSHQVCAYGINTGAGGNALIGCRTVVVPGGSPFGSLDLVAGAAGKVNVSGWVIDPDTASSIQVHVYVDGSLTPLTADGNRPDVGAAFVGYGAAHGFSAQITATPGSHLVCVYGINTGVGGNSPLGCRTVTVS
jgi:hypothetical protein